MSNPWRTETQKITSEKPIKHWEIESYFGLNNISLVIHKYKNTIEIKFLCFSSLPLISHSMKSDKNPKLFTICTKISNSSFERKNDILFVASNQLVLLYWLPNRSVFSSDPTILQLRRCWALKVLHKTKLTINCWLN